jgi:integrase
LQFKALSATRFSTTVRTLALASHLLTDLNIRSLKPPSKGQEIYWDKGLPAFGLRVSQGGTKSFVLISKGRWITIGKYHPDILPLSKARTEAKRLLAEATLGKIRPQSITYATAVELFLTDKARGRRQSTVYSYKVKLARLKFKGQLSEITHAEASRQLDRIKAPSERSHVLSAARAFFNWCVKRRYVSDNPFFGLTKSAHTPRDRVLSDRELKAIWKATDTDYAFHRIIRLCILTAQRRGELSHLKPEFISGEICTLPSTLTKNHREHSFPLTPHAKQHLTFEGFSDWGHAKAELDKACGVTDWVIHDIRRTVATRLAEMGIAPHVIERLLNHVTGTISGIAAVYNRARYTAEVRGALDRWEAHLTNVLY